MSVIFVSNKCLDGLTAAYLTLRPHERGDDVKHTLYDANLHAFKQRYPYYDVLPFEPFKPVPLPSNAQVFKSAGYYGYQLLTAFHRPDSTEEVNQAAVICETLQHEFAQRALKSGDTTGLEVWGWL